MNDPNIFQSKHEMIRADKENVVTSTETVSSNQIH